MAQSIIGRVHTELIHPCATAGEMFRSWTDADLPLTP
jgi:hypothetical protein